MLNRWLRLFIGTICLLPAVAAALNLQVNISGVDKKLNANIRADLHLQQAVSEPKLTAARVHNLYDLSAKQINTTLQAKGYYHSQITHTLTKIPAADPEQATWVANFNIQLGQPTTISNVTVHIDGPGQDDRRIKPLLATPLLVPGQILTHENYEHTKEKLIADFNSIGYLEADFTQNVIEIDRDKFTAKIKLTINTGKLYVFGQIKFIDSKYPDELLNRYLPFHPGQPYDLRKLAQLQDNLEQSDLFSKIRFDPVADLNDPNNNVVPIDVRLTPKPRNRYAGSIGYSTSTGIRGSLSWLHRRTATPGHKLFAYVGASSILRLAKINYIIPGKQAATDSYVFGTAFEEDFVNNLYSRRGEIYANKILKRGKLESIYGINYFTETFYITSNTPNQNKKYLLPNADWLWIDSYDKDNFSYGSKYEVKVRGGLKPLLSATSVIQMEGAAKQIYPLIPETRLLLRADIGAVFSKDFNSLPPSLRFFTGGDETIRGFAYDTIGPRVIPGDPYSDNNGGKYLIVASAEIERRIYKNLNGMIFFDAGNASMNFGGPLAMGTGIGVSYRLPIGSFRLYVAKPLNTIVDRRPLWYFNFGTDF